jgi:hypothetical protein
MKVYYNKFGCICLLSKVILENFVETLQMGSGTIVTKHRTEGIANERSNSQVATWSYSQKTIRP